MADKYNLGAVHQGILATEIYNGKANDISLTYNLTQSYKNFKFLLVFVEVDNKISTHSNKTFTIVDVSSVDGNQNEFRVTLDNGKEYYTIQFSLPTNTTFNINDAKSALSTSSGTVSWKTPCIYKIVGIN